MKKFFKGTRKALAFLGLAVVSVPGLILVGYWSAAILGPWAVPVFILVTTGVGLLFKDIMKK